MVIANHCFGLFELAGVYLSQSPPRLEQARLAIDAFGAVVEGVGGRLGETEGTLRDRWPRSGWPSCRSRGHKEPA